MNEDVLSAYLDGEVDATERAEVEAKLAESAEWRAVLDEVREAREAVRSLPARDAPPGWWDRVLESPAEHEVVDLAAVRERRHRRARRWAAAASAAAAAIVVAVTVVPGEDRVHPDVATFVDAHAVRSSSGNDVISNVAGAAVPEGRP